MRAQMQTAASPTDESSVSVYTAMAPGPAGAPPVPVICYRPNNKPTLLPAILHIHGGGYVLGSASMMDAENRNLASELGCMIVSVDYRLAPETAYPGPLEDCYSVLEWLHETSATWQIDPRRIGVKGESAGGGLAAGLALLVRDRGVLTLAFQHLIYPMIDDRTGLTATGLNPFVGEFIWNASRNRFGWSAFLGEAFAGPSVPIYAAAARAEDLSRLPATFISVGGLDLFLEEDIDYASRLARAGVPVELHVYPRAFHVFDLAPRTARIALAAARNSRDYLRRVLWD
jgi:acetyl esterase/lipase